jgi:hypothetical protein
VKALTEMDGRGEGLREHVLYLLRGGGAHVHFDDVVKDFPVEVINRKIAGVPYTPWQVLEHMRLAQWDILGFSRDAAHVSPDWPEGYWAGKDFAADAGAWRKSVEAFRADLKAMEELIADPASDLYAPIPHGTGQTLLREALLVADHNAYHLGVLVVLKRALEARSSA